MGVGGLDIRGPREQRRLRRLEITSLCDGIQTSSLLCRPVPSPSRDPRNSKVPPKIDLLQVGRRTGILPDRQVCGWRGAGVRAGRGLPPL